METEKIINLEKPKSIFLRENAVNRIEDNISQVRNNIGNTPFDNYSPSNFDIKRINEALEIAIDDLSPKKQEQILARSSSIKGGTTLTGANFAGPSTSTPISTTSINFEPTSLNVGELPTAKYLYQELSGRPSNDIYFTFADSCSNTEEYIPAGQGKEYGYLQGQEVQHLIDSQFIPPARIDIEKYQKWDSVTLPGNDAIFKSTISIATWRFAPYFLEGKIDEVVAALLVYLSETLKLKQSLDVIQIIGQIYSNIASQGTAETTSSNKIVGTADNLVEAVAEWKASLIPLRYHNTTYAYGTWDNSGSTPAKTAFNGYVNADINSMVHIIHPTTLNNIVKTKVINIIGGEFGSYANIEKFKEWPLTIYDPTVADTTTITTTAGFGAITTLSTIPQGVILTIDASKLKRLYNLSITKSQEYVPNLTTQWYVFKRYTQKFLKFGVCQVFKSAIINSTSGLRALDAPLVIQTSTSS